MSLPWFRCDSNIGTHDKILELVGGHPPALGYRTAFSFVAGLGYANGHGTDGLVPFHALGLVHGNRKTAELAVEHGLWVPDPAGWRPHNWAERNPSAEAARVAREARSKGARRTNCTRWHPKGCDCWKADE